MRLSEVFVDTGAWVALSIEPDYYHRTAGAIFASIVRLNRRMVTTNLVLTETYETIRRLGGTRAALTVLNRANNTARLMKVYADFTLEKQAEEILRRYDDQRFSFVDAVSFAVMRERQIAEAFAFDRHFETAGFALAQ